MHMMPKIWISDETPPRVLFAKGRSGIDPDCIVAFAEGDGHGVWIVFDGDYEFKKPDYFVCGKGGASFRARPVFETTPCSPQDTEQ